jgi:uncharacterized radical SAM protein YgiQ
MALRSLRTGDQFLPMSREEMQQLGWEQLDFLLISGDAYVDHPSFGPAIIGRVLENAGYRVGIVAQPDWRSQRDFVKLGRPRLAVLVTAGNLDSMVSNYTAAKRPRRADDYSPGGVGGKRPDLATIVYANRVRQTFKGLPLIIGGIEASLRRLAHYDWWGDKVRRSLLLDSRADILVYGMGESSLLELADRLAAGDWQSELPKLRGICYLADEAPQDAVLLPAYESVESDKGAYARAFRIAYLEQDARNGRMMAQQHGDKFLVVCPPSLPLSTAEMDRVYELPYMRQWHPAYDLFGGVPALEEVQFSLVSHRGCFGSCSFCALTAHQGRVIQARSSDSLLAEAKLLTTLPGFKGYIHDVGGPTANFHELACEAQSVRGACRDKQCLHPEICRNLTVDHREYLRVLRAMRALPGVKKVFIRSGLRYDYMLADKSGEFLRELVEHHISGQLKVAPEHISPRVTDLMGKPGREVFDQFRQRYQELNQELGKQQFLVPYFMSSHPGSTLQDAVQLAEYLRDTGLRPEQVQDFIPTPGSLSTAMFYTGLHPLTGQPVHVPRSEEEKSMQRALLQYWMPKNHALVLRALQQVGRTDLIGFDQKCLIRPRAGRSSTKRSDSPRQATISRPKAEHHSRRRRHS